MIRSAFRILSHFVIPDNADRGGIASYIEKDLQSSRRVYKNLDVAAKGSREMLRTCYELT